MAQNTSLLIVDAQVNMFDESMPIHNATTLLKNLQHLCNQAHNASIPIIFIRNDGGKGEPDEYGTAGWQIHPQLAIDDTDTILDKQSPDAFKNTPLQNLLSQSETRHLIIAGMQTEYCLNATTRRAVELGYDVTLISDAHSTFDSDEKTAPEIIAEYNTAFKQFVTLKSMDSLDF